MPKVDVSVGELFDKLSILEIKASKGLDVDTEKQKLLDVYQESVSYTHLTLPTKA